MIGAAIPGGEQSGRHPAGLGRGGGRGGDTSGAGRGGKGTGAGGKGAGSRGTPKPKPTACSVLPPRGPMCDKAHHNDCWRDPKCSTALPDWVTPETVIQIDKDKKANGLRLNEAAVPRKAADEFAGNVSEGDAAHLWEDEDVHVVDESDAADDASQAALSTPARCSVCTVAQGACGRFILGGQAGFSGTVAHVQDDKGTSCEYDPCACELLAMRASQQQSLAMPLYVIGEPCCWLQKDETIGHDKIIAPCNANGGARTLDKNGKSWLINSASIWTGPAALAVGDVKKSANGLRWQRRRDRPRPSYPLRVRRWQAAIALLSALARPSPLELKLQFCSAIPTPWMMEPH